MKLTPSAIADHSISNAVRFVAAPISDASRGLQSIAIDLVEVFQVALPKGAYCMHMLPVPAFLCKISLAQIVQILIFCISSCLHHATMSFVLLHTKQRLHLAPSKPLQTVTSRQVLTGLQWFAAGFQVFVNDPNQLHVTVFYASRLEDARPATLQPLASALQQLASQ